MNWRVLLVLSVGLCLPAAPVGAQPLPGGPAQVCLFGDWDFGGPVYCINPGTELEALPPEWNDRVSSIRVGPNSGGVFVCSDTGFAGQCDFYADDVLRLEGARNDSASSIRMGQAGPPPRTPFTLPLPLSLPIFPLPPGQACFFQDADYRGPSFCGRIGNEVPAVPSQWNDRISSLRIGAGAWVQLCTDQNFGGRCDVFQSDTRQVPLSRNDTASSYRIGQAGQPLPPTPPATIPPPPPPVIPAADEVCFFRDVDFAGDSFCAARGGQDDFLPPAWNDSISSLRVGPNSGGVYLCRDAFFQGPCDFYGGDASQLPQGRNDSASSYRIGEPPPGPPPPPPPPPGPPSPPPIQAEQACFYLDFNFSGASFCGTAGTQYTTLPPAWNDRISSLRVGSGSGGAYVCRDPNFQGQCDLYTTDIAQLPVGRNDAASSIRIGQVAQPPPPPPPPLSPLPKMRPDVACFYQNPNFGPPAFCARTGNQSTGLPAAWNDRISSLRVGPMSGGAYLCRDNFFQGPCELYTSDVAQLTGPRDNSASSLRVGQAPTPPTLPPVPNGQVCFYLDANYSGTSFCGSVGDQVSSLSSTYNNRITSARIGTGAEARICTDPMLGGQCTTLAADTPQLGPAFDNSVSSYRIVTAEAPLPPVPAGEVCFYLDANYAGTSFCASVGDQVSAIPTALNDRISSLRVGTGASARVCTNTGLSGQCTTLGSDTPTMPSGYNDSISSYRILQVGAPPPPAPPPIPADQVCFYSEWDYQGSSLCFARGTADPDLPLNWNDRISSLRIGPNSGGAMLCTEFFFAGQCNTFTTSTPRLAAGMNDQASSFRIGPPAAAPPPPPPPLPPIPAGQVCFYADFDYGGASFCRSSGDQNPALASDWNNRISSVRMHPSAWVQVCPDNSFQGACSSLGADVPRLASPLNDAISSYRVFSR